MSQLLLDLGLPPPPSMENFVTGRNGPAIAALQAWLAEEGDFALFLWGSAGCGRTHLLKASAAPLLDAESDPSLQQAPADPAPAQRLAVDNAQALNANGQVVLFNLFNRLRAAGGRLLVAADAPPAQLTLREDLRTRLGSALVYALTLLSDDEKRAALLEDARRRGMPKPEQVIDYLLAHAPRDMNTLAGLLDALDRHTLERHHPPTLARLREMLAPKLI